MAVFRQETDSSLPQAPTENVETTIGTSLDNPTITPNSSSQECTKTYNETTSLAGIPSGFFQSRASIRVWGTETLTDPAVQPQHCQNEQTLLPGYASSCYKYFNELDAPEAKQQKFMSIEQMLGAKQLSSTYSRANVHKVQVAMPPPLHRLGDPSYNYEDLSVFKMNHLPYVNALMNPRDGADMYVQSNYLTGYPYGVPAVEENEAMGNGASGESENGTVFCNFLC